MRTRAGGARQTVSLRAVALVIALSPMLTEIDELSCDPPGDTTLSELAVEIGGENLVAFDPEQRAYSVMLPPETEQVVVRAIPNDLDAAVWVNYYSEDGHEILINDVPGGGEETLDVIPGSTILRVYVKAPEGAVDYYDANIMLFGPMDM